ncbi:hypothetical protein MHBO_000810 [Bonamia ostreae]|uniref:Uncharacterized protein n=1 Tax=Bonamia ostreae TaxID=126728 RepID=A0ABV2AGW9_9EUKA
MRMDLSKLLEKSVFKKIALSLLVSLILFGITVCVNLNIPPRVVTVKEDIPFLSHPVIRTHIGKKFLALTCFLLPIAIFAVVEYILDEAFSLMQILLFASTILLSINITYVVTATLKIAVGRLRPNFYELCSYDKLLEKCTASVLTNLKISIKLIWFVASLKNGRFLKKFYFRKWSILKNSKNKRKS